MDFSFTDEQQALADLAGQILGDAVTHERLTELEAAGGAVFDREAWSRLADAGVLAAVVPEPAGGSGLAIDALVGVFEAVGRTVAPVPLVATVVGALALARFGDGEIRAELPRGVAAGSTILALALDDVDATADGTTLSGTAARVPWAPHADALIVAAGDGLYVVDPSSDGVSLTEQTTTNRQPTADVDLDGAAASLLSDDRDARRWLLEHTAAALCVVQAGVCDGALRMTAAHTSQREQFGKPIAEFQAVAQRAADAYIDTEMVRLTAWQALFRLARGWPATQEVHVAKFWAGDGGMRVLHAAQHLHGGLGVDTSYPLHRYFLWGKQIEHTVGTPTRELIRLGDVLADDPV